MGETMKIRKKKKITRGVLGFMDVFDIVSVNCLDTISSGLIFIPTSIRVCLTSSLLLSASNICRHPMLCFCLRRVHLLPILL